MDIDSTLFPLLIIFTETIQGAIVAKRAMPTLFHLAMVYAQNAASPPRPPSPPMSLVRMASNLSLHTKSIKRIETVVVILINITHIVYQMVPNSKFVVDLKEFDKKKKESFKQNN
jgi:hypothetical protein